MRFQKVLTGLSASPSQIKRNLKHMKPGGYDMDVHEMLKEASSKLKPIIDLLTRTSRSPEHFIGVRDCDHLEQITQIMKAVTKMLEDIGFKTEIKPINLNMQKYRKKVNSAGYIHVDTTLLLGILELNSLVENIRDDLDTFYRSIGVHSFVQTESGLISVTNTDSIYDYNPNKIIFKLNTSPGAKDSFTFLKNEFLLMPSAAEIPLVASQSQILGGVAGENDTPIRKSMSDISFDNEKISGVTDVYGARKILVKCIYDLKGISEYLGTPRKDAFTVYTVSDGEPDDFMEYKPPSRLSVPRSSTRYSKDDSIRASQDQLVRFSKDESIRSSLKEPVRTSKDDSARGSLVPSTPPPTPTQMLSPSLSIAAENASYTKPSAFPPGTQQKCCCPECFADRGPGDLAECEDDQVIICIKGCNEDEGDVQIVIRQCPECKASSEARQQQYQKSFSDSAPPQEKKKELPSAPEESKTSLKPRVSKGQPARASSVMVPPSVIEEEEVTDAEPEAIATDGEQSDDTESSLLHNKDSKGSVICSDEEDEEKKEDGEEPKKSQDITPVQNLTGCSRIKLFETTNLCLETEAGEELVISLTVTPKELAAAGAAPQHLSISDIFSDTDDSVGQSKERPSKARPSVKSQSKSVNYYVPDRYIPLGRTKICSSLDFDVTTANSKIRNKGIKNRNNKIVVQLQHFGADNLLRACRPAKCCRKSVLNEKMKKCLPYAPSIRSLPLDDDDISVINQSLQMSLQKVKNSTNLQREFYANQMNMGKPVKTVLYFFVEGDFSQKTLEEMCKKVLVRRKLSYYINLVSDATADSRCRLDVFYFGVENSSKPKNAANQDQQHKSTSGPGSQKTEVEVLSSPMRWIRQKYSSLSDAPISTQKQRLLLDDPTHLAIRTIRNNIGARKKLSENNVKTKKALKNVRTSKIPVYCGHAIPLKVDKSEHAYQKQHKEVTIEDSSASTIQRRDTEDKITTDACSGGISAVESRKENGDCLNMKSSIAIQSLGTCSSGYSKHKYSSNSSDFNVGRRTKRKKKEFYLSRSRSEISLNTLRCLTRNKKIAPVTLAKDIREIATETINNHKVESKKSFSLYKDQAAKVLIDPEATKVVLSYFSKVLYEMVMTQVAAEPLINNQPKKLSVQRINIGIGPGSASLQEIFMKKSKFGIEVSCHPLKAKHSQYAMVPGQNNAPDIYMFNNLALQTSRIIGVNKNCQTSSTLLAYIFNPNFVKAHDFDKKSMFKKTYNYFKSSVYDQSSSCDEIENFTVTFKSEDSLKSSNLYCKGFTNSNTWVSSHSTDSEPDSLGRSLMRLKETLEQYEEMKSQIVQNNINKDSPINPIEYFVYHQVCACYGRKAEKKPSIMQKIVSKTKELFSSPEKDMCRKYKNQRAFFSLPEAERNLCHNCGCSIAKCAPIPSSGPKTEPADFQHLLCSCPEEFKPATKPKGHTACCKKSKSKTSSNTLCNLSKFASSSISSIKARFKKSSSGSLKRNKGDFHANKESGKDTVLELCVDDSVKIVKCEKSAGSTKDSSTQKCECGKCENFSDDGTCCCSHCLGCLDKSFEAKPNNQNVGIATETSGNTQVIPSPPTFERTATNSDTPGNTSTIPTESAGVPVDDENIETIDTSEADNKRPPNEGNATYYFLSPPPQMFPQFSFSTANPFEQCLYNMPNIFHRDRPDNA